MMEALEACREELTVSDVEHYKVLGQGEFCTEARI